MLLLDIPFIGRPPHKDLIKSYKTMNNNRNLPFSSMQALENVEEIKLVYFDGQYSIVN